MRSAKRKVRSAECGVRVGAIHESPSAATGCRAGFHTPPPRIADLPRRDRESGIIVIGYTIVCYPYMPPADLRVRFFSSACDSPLWVYPPSAGEIHESPFGARLILSLHA